MKLRSVRILIILLTALFAGTSWADNVVNTINQGGNNNGAAVIQPGVTNDNNEATILQGNLAAGNSENNLAQINQINNTPLSPLLSQNAIIVQGGGFLDIAINVPSDLRLLGYIFDPAFPALPPLVNTNNKAVTDQGTNGTGFTNFSLTVQNGNGNVAYTRQNTGLNAAGIIQGSAIFGGTNLNAYIEQGNSGLFGVGLDFAKIVQHGLGHRASIEQTSNPFLGTRLPSVNLFGGGNSAEIRQTNDFSANNSARIVQTGFGNNSIFDPAKISQTGQDQRALIYQTGDGSTHASIEQGGGLNTAAIFQVQDGGLSSNATHSATIVQGPLLNLATQNHAIVWQSGAAASHSALVTQSDLAQTALVYQTQKSVSGDATVTQTNTLNLGVVVQGDKPLNLFEQATDPFLGQLLSPVEAGISGTPPNLTGGPAT
jgi:hypothetical protein